MTEDLIHLLLVPLAPKNYPSFIHVSIHSVIFHLFFCSFIKKLNSWLGAEKIVMRKIDTVANPVGLTVWFRETDDKNINI